MRKFNLFLIALLFGGAMSALGNGYQVTLKSARTTAMGNTGTGLAYDASAIFFNPGALGFNTQNNIALGASFISADINYIGAGTSNYIANNESNLSTPFYLFGSYGITDKLTAGLGIFTPFGSTVGWEDNWTGEVALDELSLAAFFVQPTLSYKINDQLSIGAGLDIVFGSVNLQRALPFADQNGNLLRTELDGSTEIGFGFNVGIFYMPNDKLSIGASYKSKVDATIEGGDATFVTTPQLAAAGLVPASTTFDATLPLVANLSIGTSFYPTEKLTISAQFDFVEWSAYEELRFDWGAPVGGEMASVSARNYENSFALRIGGEYMATDNLALRLGFYYDGSPVPDGYMTPETPDSDTTAPTIGIGYKFGNFSIDAYGLLIMRPDRYNEGREDAGNISGTYQARTPVFGFGLTYDFSKSE
ncbi:MAG: outer membrane protein transport protein [Bacteroidota bacterium]